MNFGDKKIKTKDFYKNKKVIKTDDTDLSKILVSKEEPYGLKNSFKYFIGYSDNDVIRPLCKKLHHLFGYVKKFGSSTTMSFKISDKQLLKKHNQIWRKVKNLLKIKFNSEPINGDNDKYIKTKTKIYDGNVNTIFKRKEYQKKKHHTSVYQ